MNTSPSANPANLTGLPKPDAFPDPQPGKPDQWSLVCKEDVPELWGQYRRGGGRHNGKFVYPCLDRAHALDLLRSLLESRRFYLTRKAQAEYTLGKPSAVVTETLGRK